MRRARGTACIRRSANIAGMVILTRRELIRLLGGAAAVAAMPGCKEPEPVAGGPFTPSQRATLSAFADVIVPPDDEPGGAALGVVTYIERLITAFDVAGTPPIFARGPFSGRSVRPGVQIANDWLQFIELDRVSEAAWRQRVTAMHDALTAGLDAAGAIDGKSGDEIASLFNGQDDAFKDLAIDLVIEGCFCAPEYGGNLDRAGWKLCNFEGDSLPLGYSRWDGRRYVERPEAPLSTANPGEDPAPIDVDVDQLMKTVIAFLGGRTA